MPAANTPCKNPQLCKVQSHRPGTVAACASQSASGAGKSASAKLSSTPAPLSSSQDNAEPITYWEFKENASEEAQAAHQSLIDGGYYGYPQLEDEQFLENLAKQKNIDPDALKEAAEMMNADWGREQAEKTKRHGERADEIIAQTPHHGKYVKKGMRVVVDDGTEGGRIVKVTVARNGKVWGDTIDAYGEEYIDGWDVNKIKVPKD